MLLKRQTGERSAYLVCSPAANLLKSRGLGRDSRGFLLGFLPLLFLLASCSGGGGGGGQGAPSVELAFTPGNGRVTVDLIEKRSLTRLLNISTYQLTAIDSADEADRVEGGKLAEEAFNGSTLMPLTNNHNYTFALRVFYFPVGSAELSNLSLGIDYAAANARNIRDAGGITIGINTDGDYLANLVDGDDDNDGVNDVNTEGEELDLCSPGELRWLSNETTDNDGDGCRDKTEDDDDDNDGIADVNDLCPSGEVGWQRNAMTDIDDDGCRDETEDTDDDGDGVNDLDSNMAPLDRCPRGERNWQSSKETDNDGDGCRDETEDLDDDNDDVPDLVDIDADGDGLIEIGTAAELNAVRWALDGSGQRLSERATLNQTGCGNEEAGICNGYELTQDISLTDYMGGEGWLPLGRDTEPGGDCQGEPFSGTFDGNGFTVSELNINRPTENCIGLFGYLAENSVIRNLIVEANKVIGNGDVGGLVGYGFNAKIVSSFSAAREVTGNSNAVGGLIGFGSRAKILSSLSVTGKVSGVDFVAGLVGSGSGVEVISSASIANEVKGESRVGGLIGFGTNFGDIAGQAIVSYSVTGRLEGTNFVGGLIASGRFGIDNVPNTKMISSYSVAGEVNGTPIIGGLIASDGEAVDSYWHTAVAIAGEARGEEKTLAELRMPTNDNAFDAGSIYANWDDGADIDDTAGVEAITIYCDEDLSGAIEAAERRDGSLAGENDNRIWDFGGTDDYPAIRCLPLSLAEQRSWWFINNTGHPNVNQDRLDMLAP